MPPWTPNPVLVAQLLERSPRETPVRLRRLAVLNALDRYSFTPWRKIVQHVENELGASVFGTSPQARVWGDIRALREAGIMIDYSRTRRHISRAGLMHLALLNSGAALWIRSATTLDSRRCDQRCRLSLRPLR